MRNKGFALIELIIVLVLIGLAISLVAPSFSRVAKNVELKAAAKKTSGILRYYRSEAVHRGKVHQVLFDSGLREVRIQAIDGEEDPGVSEKMRGQGLIKKYQLPPGIQMKELNIPVSQYPSELPAIEFYPNGGSNGGIIILDSQHHKGFKIKVHFLTGIVEIEGA